MAGFLTNYANNKVLDMFFGSNAFTPPTILYFGLSTSVASKGGGGISEPSGGGYARASLANNATNFPAATLGTKANSSTIGFPAPTADWGVIQCLFVSDAPTGGNILAMADLSTPKLIKSGSAPPVVAAGALFLSHT
jgi:hypothetical protein